MFKFQATNVHGNVTNVDIQRNDAIDGAQSMIIVGTLLLTKNMERTAQGAPKVLDIKNITLPRFPFANLSYFKNF